MTQNLKDILIFSVKTLCSNLSWFAPLSPLQKFCFGIVATVCGKIPITAENFKWANQFQYVINKLGKIFRTYCKTRAFCDRQCMLSVYMPEEVDKCQSDDVQNYFHWVRNVQDLLYNWQNKFQQFKVNYDEILQYADYSKDITDLGQAVCSKSSVMEIDEIEEVKKKYVQCFTELNVHLVRYVRNQPEVKYCTLPELLNKYGVSLPSELQKSMSHTIIFPSFQKIPFEHTLCNVQPPLLSNVFESGQATSLIFAKSVSFVDLQTMLNQIYQFLQPVVDLMDMLVFFHLHGSKMFEKHLLKRLHDLTSASSQKAVKSFLMPAVLFDRSDSSIVRDKGGVSIDTLQKALQNVKKLLISVIKGTATYSDIIANGALPLKSLNVETEFGILARFEFLEMKHEQCKGLEGVRCMLELFQFTHHINKINSVCHQYGLTKCLEDGTLKHLMVIVEELKSEKSRDSLMLIKAIEKMGIVKKALCLGERTNYSCLDLFPAIADSAAFYQLVRDKQFMGARGQIMFQEQYQLITAQLQHEEYDENVLNHLRAAFELIAPFTEHDISFPELMSKVVRFETTHGLKQLETVNENITLIRLWFSRAEVCHISH